MSSTSKLRRPNFNLLPFVPNASPSSPHNASSSSSSRVAVAAAAATIAGGGGGDATTATTAYDPPSASQQLANYARLCHERILLSHDFRDEDAEDNAEGDDHAHRRRRRDEDGNLVSDAIGDESRKRSKAGPSMERCIALLEPIIGTFRSNCIAKDEERTRRPKGRPVGDDRDGESDGEGDEVDEVPPQLTRVARFFPHQFSPMRRALLRPLPPPDEDGVVELAAHYRLRLAGACRARGLVADAEFEALSRSFDRARDNDNGDDNDDDSDDDVALMERVRLSLMRLPADVALTSSSSRGRSIAAWRHVDELMSRCRARWEDNDGGASDDDERDGGSATASRRIVSPDQVADWAMSSWTAMLLLRGLDRPVPRCTHLGVGVDVGGVIDPVEGRLAALLSDRRDGDARSAATTSTTTLARAVKRRIDFLLSPANISSLNGIHLYSLGRLLASFRARDDAMMHVVLSVCRCGLAAMGSGGRSESGLVGLEQLSRLLAVFACCCTSASSTTTAATTSTSANAVSIVRDLEIGIRAKLEDDELVRTIMADCIADERGGGGGGADLRAAEKRVQRKYHSTALVKRRAMSFMDAVLSATAHLVKCCDK